MNEIVAWGKKNYVLGAGNDRDGPVDLEESAPWCVKVCEDRLDPRVRVQTVNKSTQSSGTILGEIISAYTLDRCPGNMAINCQTDPDAAKFARTRFMPRLKKIPSMAAVLPSREGMGRYNITTTEIFFPDNTFLRIQGPGENNAQSFSASYMWNDEPYLYEKGRIAEFTNRTGSFWNPKTLNTSVGAKTVGSDLDVLYVEGTQEEWNLRCLAPGCGELFVPTWWKTRYGKFIVQWDRKMEEGEATNYARLAATVVRVCPHCGERHPDTRKVNRAMTAFGRGGYVPFNPGGNREKPSYRWNKLAPWNYSTADRVETFLKALDAKRTGNMAPLEKFVMMDMAETYNRREHESFGASLTRPSGNYSLDDVETAAFKTAYPVRILAWDKQAGANERLEGVCRAFGKNPDGTFRSRLVWTGTEENEAKARIRQQELGVYDALTAEDCAHKPDEVYDACARYRWVAMIGAVRESWEHPPSGVHQVKTSRPYSAGHYERGCWRISWSNSRIKEIVFAKRTQQDMKDDQGRPRTEEWGVPNDAPQPYLIQINQRPILKPDNTFEWPEGNDHRHDCECMIEGLWQCYKDGLFPEAPKL